MQITVNAEIFVRFARLARQVRPDDSRYYMRSVLVEVCAGGVYLFATDSRFGAVQRIGDAPGEMRRCVTVDDYFFETICKEAEYSSSVIVSEDSVKTTFGFVYPGNPFVTSPPGKNNELHYWRDIFKTKPEEHHGTMYLDSERMEFMRKCSPSGCILFPNKIDTRQPIIVKDSLEPNWLGAFVGYSTKGNEVYGKLPEWIK